MRYDFGLYQLIVEQVCVCACVCVCVSLTTNYSLVCQNVYFVCTNHSEGALGDLYAIKNVV